MDRLSSRIFILIIIALSLVASSNSINLSAKENAKTIRIIYSNDTLGYLESCGCGGNNDGGLPRRATLIKKLTAEQPNAIILESGNLAHTSDKLYFVTKILSLLKYDAIGIGETDAQIVPQLMKYVNDFKLQVVDCLLEPNSYVAPYIIKNIDGIKVGIVSFGAVPVFNAPSESEVRKRRYAAFKEARNASDILILLDQANLVDVDWLQKNEKRLGLPDFVIGGIRNIGLTQEKAIGPTYILPTSNQGRHIGVVDVEIVDGKVSKVSCQKIRVGPPIEADPEIAKIVDEALHGTGLPGSKVSFDVKPVDASKPYYSPDYCKNCHIKEYQDWIRTDHAKAVQTLIRANRLVPDCLPCHSEEYIRTSSVFIPYDGLRGVECATCHMDALPHGMERKNVAEKTRVNPQICLKCHTKERSPNYDESIYLPMVSHK